MSSNKNPIESILSMMRLCIGSTETEEADEEEKGMIEEICRLGDQINKVIEKDNPKLIIATVTLTQILEDLLCNYEEEMPYVVTAVVSKLSSHGAEHIKLKDGVNNNNHTQTTIH
jgi:hypothetical protein